MTIWVLSTYLNRQILKAEMAKPCFWGLLTYWGVPMSALHHLLQLTEGGCHFDIVVPVATNHALRSHVVEEGDGGVPER